MLFYKLKHKPKRFKILLMLLALNQILIPHLMTVLCLKVCALLLCEHILVIPQSYPE